MPGYCSPSPHRFQHPRHSRTRTNANTQKACLPRLRTWLARTVSSRAAASPCWPRSVARRAAGRERAGEPSSCSHREGAGKSAGGRAGVSGDLAAGWPALAAGRAPQLPEVSGRRPATPSKAPEGPQRLGWLRRSRGGGQRLLSFYPRWLKGRLGRGARLLAGRSPRPPRTVPAPSSSSLAPHSSPSLSCPPFRLSPSPVSPTCRVYRVCVWSPWSHAHAGRLRSDQRLSNPLPLLHDNPTYPGCRSCPPLPSSRRSARPAGPADYCLDPTSPPSAAAGPPLCTSAAAKSPFPRRPSCRRRPPEAEGRPGPPQTGPDRVGGRGSRAEDRPWSWARRLSRHRHRRRPGTVGTRTGTGQWEG